MSEIKVNSIKGVGASVAAISIDNADGTCTANITNRTNKNLIINEDFQLTQRSTSSTTNGYGSVDRFYIGNSGVDEAPTHAQVDVASGTTPYTLGFRKALKITNGNQTSGAGAGDYIFINHFIEAQNLAQSGWNYVSSSSNITLSFWVKSSVAQNFYFQFGSRDGSQYSYPMETGSLTADTWTKVTKTISGNSNIQVNNDNGAGAVLTFGVFWGTNLTGSVSLNSWMAKDDANKTPDNPTGWYTTNDATFEITGVQLEVGSFATDFEHRSYAQELALCQRYYYLHAAGTGMGGNSGETTISENATMYQSNNMFCSIKFPTQMRAKPTLEVVTGSNYYLSFSDGSSRGNFTGSNTSLNSATSTNIAAINNSDTGSSTGGHAAIWRTSNAAAKVAFTAEL